MIRSFVLFLSLAALPALSQADMVALDDQSLSQQQGAGIAFALEDFVFDVNDAVTTVTGIESSDENQVLQIEWTELYIMGEGSENGTLDPKPKAQICTPGSFSRFRAASDWIPLTIITTKPTRPLAAT